MSTLFGVQLVLSENCSDDVKFCENVNNPITSIMVQIKNPNFDVYSCAFNLEFTNIISGRSFTLVMYAEGLDGKFTAPKRDIERALSESGLNTEDNNWSLLKVKAKKFDDPKIVCQPVDNASYIIKDDGSANTFKIDVNGQLTMMGLPIVAASKSNIVEPNKPEPEFSQGITSVIAQIEHPTFKIVNCVFNLEFTNNLSGKSFNVVMRPEVGSVDSFKASKSDIEKGLVDAGLNAEDNNWSQLTVKPNEFNGPFVSCHPAEQSSYQISKNGAQGIFKVDRFGQLTVKTPSLLTAKNINMERSAGSNLPEDSKSKIWYLEMSGVDKEQVVKRLSFYRQKGISKIVAFQTHSDAPLHALAFGPFDDNQVAKQFFKNKKLNLLTKDFNPARLQQGIEWYEILDLGKTKKDTLTSPLIGLVQNELNRIGCEVGPADGIFGRKTLRGIDRYQSQAAAKFQIPKIKDEVFFAALHKLLVSEKVMRNCVAKPETGATVNDQAGEASKETKNGLKKSANSIFQLFEKVIDCSVNIALLNPKGLSKCAGETKNE